MRAIQLVSRETLQARDVDAPALGAGDVMIHVRAAGVCETDLHVYHRGDPSRLPLTLGHEFSGEVVAVGADVTNCRRGDRVVAEPCIVCGACRFCRAGRPNLCVKLNHLGLSSDGAFADYVAAPARNVHRLPDNVSFAAGALAEPLGCALHGLQRARLQPREDVLIIGDGFFGRVFSQIARAMGAGRIVVLGHHADRLAQTREEGADVALDERAPEVAEVVGGMSEGLGPDVTVDTVGTDGSLARALELAGRGGRIAVFGVAARQATISTSLILRKEVDILGALSSSTAWPDVIALLASERIHPARLISRTLPLDDLAEAFRLKASRAPDISKIVVTQEA